MLLWQSLSTILEALLTSRDKNLNSALIFVSGIFLAILRIRTRVEDLKHIETLLRENFLKANQNGFKNSPPFFQLIVLPLALFFKF